MVKTNNFNTGNVLRDLHLQCLFHPMEYCDRVCAALAWDRLQYFNRCREAATFKDAEINAFVHEQMHTINIRLHALQKIVRPQT